MSAGTIDDSCTIAEDMQVSPAIAKPNVSSSLSQVCPTDLCEFVKDHDLQFVELH